MWYGKDEYVETYKIDAVCENCGEKYSVSIPTGQLVKDYLAHMPCNNCKCKTLVKDN